MLLYFFSSWTMNWITRPKNNQMEEWLRETIPIPKYFLRFRAKTLRIFKSQIYFRLCVDCILETDEYWAWPSLFIENKGIHISKIQMERGMQDSYISNETSPSFKIGITASFSRKNFYVQFVFKRSSSVLEKEVGTLR